MEKSQVFHVFFIAFSKKLRVFSWVKTHEKPMKKKHENPVKNSRLMTHEICKVWTKSLNMHENSIKF